MYPETYCHPNVSLLFILAKCCTAFVVGALTSEGNQFWMMWFIYTLETTVAFYNPLSNFNNWKCVSTGSDLDKMSTYLYTHMETNSFIQTNSFIERVLAVLNDNQYNLLLQVQKYGEKKKLFFTSLFILCQYNLSIHRIHKNQER